MDNNENVDFLSFLLKGLII